MLKEDDFYQNSAQIEALSAANAGVSVLAKDALWLLASSFCSWRQDV